MILKIRFYQHLEIRARRWSYRAVSGNISGGTANTNTPNQFCAYRSIYDHSLDSPNLNNLFQYSWFKCIQNKSHSGLSVPKFEKNIVKIHEVVIHQQVDRDFLRLISVKSHFRRLAHFGFDRKISKKYNSSRIFCSPDIILEPSSSSNIFFPFVYLVCPIFFFSALIIFYISNNFVSLVLSVGLSPLLFSSSLSVKSSTSVKWR